MKIINIIIPAYNEEARLPKTLTALYYEFFKADSTSKLAENYEIKVFVIDDGSKDDTTKVAEKMLSDYNIPGNVLSYSKNRGKGYAVKYGMLNSPSADYYYLADADLSSQWDVLEKLTNELAASDADAAIGSRALPGSEIDTATERFVSGRASNFIINMILRLGFKDTQCGYKLFSVKCLRAFQLQEIDRWGFDFEILYILKLLGMKVIEVPIKWQNREGSKVKPSDYVKTVQQLFKVKLTKYKI